MSDRFVTRSSDGRRAGPSRVLSVVAILALLLTTGAACGEADATPGIGDRPAGTPIADATPAATQQPSPDPGGTIMYPDGADDLVLLIQVTGGLVPPHALVTELPWVAVYGDGRVITQGPVIAIYPGPALPNLQVTQLTPAGMQTLLRAARDAGLMKGDAEYTSSNVADAQTTIFTVNAEGQTHQVSVYALEFDEIPTSTSVEELEARQRLRDFRQHAADIHGLIPAEEIAGDDQPYDIERLQLVIQPADEAAAPSDPSIDPGEMTWPLETPAAEFGEPYLLQRSRCGVVEGSELAPMLIAMRMANQLTRWESDGELYLVYPRPLLPHEQGCGRS
jgi:hypothetical protein